MSVTSAALVPRDGSLTITDGTGTPLSFGVVYEDGDFSLTGIKKDSRAQVAFRDRGSLYSVRETETEDMSFSFSAHLVYLRGDGTTAGIEEVVRRLGAWSAAISTLPAAAGGGPSGAGTYTLTVTWSAERTDFGHSQDQGVALKYCSLNLDFSEGVPGKISISGTVYVYGNDYLTVT